MVNGTLLMHKRELIDLDEEAITAKARALAPGVWERYRSYVPENG